jgi:hypothetical protein
MADCGQRLERARNLARDREVTGPHAMPTFQKPRKAILSKEQLAQFQASQCHNDIVSYIESLNTSVIGVKLSDECPQSLVSRAYPCIGN